MKQSLFIFLSLVFIQGHAQNMISNGGFETYSSLPTSAGQFNLAAGWNNCGGGGSPDYFHTNGSGIVQLPNCFVGTVNPHTGNACMGGALWYYSPANFREYFSTTLSSPMVVGKTYSVSFYICNGITSGTYGGGGVDQVSVLFSKAPLTQPGSGPIIRNAHYIYPGIFYSPAWQQMSFQFIADSAYQVFTIGNFKNDAASIYQQFDSCSRPGAYYFLDDIIVEPAVSGLPVPVFTSSDTVFCNEGGQCIDFFDQSTGNPTSWQWIFPGAVPDTSTSQNPTGICYYNPGTYAVTLIVSNANGSNTSVVSPMITFGSGAVVPVLIMKGDTLFSNYASAYQWYFNGSPIPGATDSFYVAQQDGSYNVYITDSIGCSRLGNGLMFTGVDDLTGWSDIKVYPNPVKNELILLSSKLEENTTVEFYNVLGEKVYSRDYPQSTADKELKVDVSFIIPGIYFYKVMDRNKMIFSGKVIIQR